MSVHLHPTALDEVPQIEAATGLVVRADGVMVMPPLMSRLDLEIIEANSLADESNQKFEHWFRKFMETDK